MTTGEAHGVVESHAISASVNFSISDSPARCISPYGRCRTGWRSGRGEGINFVKREAGITDIEITFGEHVQILGYERHEWALVRDRICKHVDLQLIQDCFECFFVLELRRDGGTGHICESSGYLNDFGYWSSTRNHDFRFRRIYNGNNRRRVLVRRLLTSNSICSRLRGLWAVQERRQWRQHLLKALAFARLQPNTLRSCKCRYSKLRAWDIGTPCLQ